MYPMNYSNRSEHLFGSNDGRYTFVLEEEFDLTPDRFPSVAGRGVDDNGYPVVPRRMNHRLPRP